MLLWDLWAFFICLFVFDTTDHALNVQSKTARKMKRSDMVLDMDTDTTWQKG
jgi:hypothetical protein